ncbi:MAG: hypothetical protein RSC44_01550 [Clostridia bacterium]
MSNESAVIKCASCGADMVYSPEKRALVCPYCGGTREIKREIPISRDYNVNVADDPIDETVNTYECPNCGGSVELVNFATATKCPFCGATNIEKRANMSGIKPDSILPFALSQNEAMLAGKKWLKRKIFAPYKLKKDFKGDKFNGIYIPVFAFSSETFSEYSGTLGIVKTRMVGSGEDRHREKYTEWFNVSGNFDINYNDLLIEASTQLTQAEMEKIMPYDMPNLEAYNREYLAGFSAERYSTPLDQSFETAKGKMYEDIKKGIINRYNADKVQTLDINTNFCNIKYRYAMTPLWVCAYKYKEKFFRFVMNGRNGKAIGKVPLSPLRIAFAVLLGLGVLTGLVLIWLFFISGYIVI